MTIVIAPDKFKGSLSADQVCKAISEGLHTLSSSWQLISIPLADGGEGTSELLTTFSNGTYVKVKVKDPLFREIESGYGISEDGKMAFIEMAKASGLQLLKPHERNPLHTSTFGTGQLIADAMERGAIHIVLGIGGSATNDAGIGMAAALGFSFLSANNEKLKPVGESLIHIHSIHSAHAHPLLDKVKFTLLCDVNNPLYGKHGASFVFGAQKGANDSIMKILEDGLRHFEKMAEVVFKTQVNFPGAGAAGGLGAGAKVFLKAEIREGFKFISRFTKLEDKIKLADVVITGEGKMDNQTLSGKVVSGVAKLAVLYQKTCIAFTGKCELSQAQWYALGIQKVISLVNETTLEPEAIKDAYAILKQRTIETFVKGFNI